MILKTHKLIRNILILMAAICSFLIVDAQDSKPKVKPKPATTTKPPAVKTQPKTNTTQTDNKYGTVTDIDGNVYKTVKIGNQIWMAENLKTTRYNNGMPIPNVTDNNEWSNLTTGAYCYYDNDYSNNAIYGKLYNWYAVNTGKLAPKGWHIPSDKEWQQLINYLGGESIAGGKMKSTEYWNSPNKGASNNSGFNALPAGNRFRSGEFSSTYLNSYFWSFSLRPKFYGLDSKKSRLETYNYWDMTTNDGVSIRCIKD